MTKQQISVLLIISSSFFFSLMALTVKLLDGYPIPQMLFLEE